MADRALVRWAVFVLGAAIAFGGFQLWAGGTGVSSPRFVADRVQSGGLQCSPVADGSRCLDPGDKTVGPEGTDGTMEGMVLEAVGVLGILLGLLLMAYPAMHWSPHAMAAARPRKARPPPASSGKAAEEPLRS